MNKLKKLWNSLVYAGSEGLADHNPQRGTCIGLNLMSLWIALINLSLGLVFYLLSGIFAVFLGSYLGAALMSLLIWLNYRRMYNAANIGFYLILNAATFYFSSLMGRAIEAQLMIVFLIGSVLFIFEKIALRILCITTTIMVLILLELNFKYQLVKPVEIAEPLRDIMRWSAYAVIIFLVILIFYLYTRNNSRLLNRLKDYSGQIEVNLEKEERENRMKTIFISNAYHEVRGSFFGVFVIIQILSEMEGMEKLQDWKKLIFNLRSACENLKMVLNNILEYSKYSSGIHDQIYPEPVNIRQLIRNLVDIGQYSASEKMVHIDLFVSGDIPEFVECDRLKITQIATNIMSNAIKFTRRESSIQVRIEKESNYWKINVEDAGEGMNSEKMDRIFEQPFVTEKNSDQNREGVGLGLHITRHLVATLKGKIMVNSKKGEGTSVTVYIPMASPVEKIVPRMDRLFVNS
ncbi:MAG: HAMP domain-containing histidine kinase [Chitinophagaceae bacterium]|nr:HAMP domain-containing histidine kinase [Chitinophagaceae bacterium]